MAKEKPSIPKGTRDFGPEEVAKRKYILNTIEKVFIKYGFMPIETPTMENLSTLTGKYGDEGDKLLFKILDNGDIFKEIKEKNAEQKISNFEFRISDISGKGLRYDLTVPFARYVVMNRNEITFPFKRYQMQPVWRADRPQKGRYREFWQCDADVVGSDSLLHELDLINIYSEVFKCLGIEVEIKINNRKILAGIAEGLGAENKLMDFTVSLDKIDKIGIDGVEKELREKGFDENQIQMVRDILFTEKNSVNYSDNTIKSNLSLSHLSMLKNSSKFRDNEKFKKGIDEIETVLENLNSTNKTVNIKLDISLARGLSYYTGCIFEVAAIEGSLRSSIGGGGRYDNLTGIFGLEGVSGVGISFGLDRIYDVIEELKLFPETLSQGSSKVLICANDSIENIELAPVLQLLNKLRNEGIASEIYSEKINVKKPLEKPIKYASSKAIPYALIYTENQHLKFKNLSTGFQEELTIEEIIERLQD